MSDNLVTEARVDVYEAGAWEPKHGRSFPIPEATVYGQQRVGILRRYEDATGVKAAPVRVIDSAGTVVQQWGRT